MLINPRPIKQITMPSTNGAQLTFFVLGGEISAPVQDGVKDDAHNRADRIGDREGGKRIHFCGRGFGTDVIRNIGRHDQRDRPDICKHHTTIFTDFRRRL